MHILSIVCNTYSIYYDRSTHCQPNDKKVENTIKTRSALFSSDSFQTSDSSTSLIKEFSLFSELEEIVSLASNSLPQRPDGIVTIVKFSSLQRQECKETEFEYERLSKLHPDTLFLRCFVEYEDADLLFSQAKVLTLPTFDVFYKNNRVGRIEGNQYTELEKYIEQYGVLNSQLNLFEQGQENKDQLKWENSNAKAGSFDATPRTTGRFIPGYDWDTKKGFFDDQADKLMQDFEGTYENWTPNIFDE